VLSWTDRLAAIRTPHTKISSGFGHQREKVTVSSKNAPITDLLQQAAQGERHALDRVFAALYPDLRRIAHARLQTQGGVAHLNTTALVHESFLRLVESNALRLVDRKHFFTYAAKTMRNIIIDFAREHLAQRRGGGSEPLAFDAALDSMIGSGQGDEMLIRINDALLELEAMDADLARIVEMRYFAGYDDEEIGKLLDRSGRTVRRQWEKARAYLLASME
jgi:RNA polymerase sigma factor (TIGR02999 family)